MRPGERQEAHQGDASVLPVAPADAPVPPSPAEDPVAGAEPPAPIPEAVRLAARRAPGHWIGMADPEFTGDDTPPEWAVLGEWRSEEGGDVGEYRPNPAYRPSPRVLGWPEPTDPVDAAAQRAATGYGTVGAALAALAEADVTVVRGPDGSPLTAPGRDGDPVVLVFTSPAHAFMSSALHHDTLPARELARSQVGTETMLLVNAAAAAPLFIPADSLRQPAGAATTKAAAPEAVDGTLATPPPGTGPSTPWPHTTGRTTP
ncbi:type VII secretion system-associated protein [Streptomyces sp. NPDC001941]|uniref:type VII secretion system-associated protein n=1 Tax=Streptomyces sp. NPDC001941 TaxID=3154659 RepID=UPI00332D2ABA